VRKFLVASATFFCVSGLAFADDAITQLSEAFEKVAEIAKPSVVNISVSKRIAKQPAGQPRGPQANPFQGTPFQDFFNNDMLEKFFQMQPPPGSGGGVMPQGMGTGMVVDVNGHILTNNHVLGDSDQISVRLGNKKTYDAKIIGRDPKTDLAVIKITAPDLVPVAFGDSDKVKIGEWVVAAGNPFGLDNSITAGIVSAKGRSAITDPTQYEDFIQTDAAINPGNSGGPLLNLKGEVIGVNSAILTRSGGYMGIGFAIPAKMARGVMQSLIKDGKVTRGFLGIMIQNFDQDMAASFGFDSTEGALVGDVNPGSPADKAGLRQGDIVVEFGGQKITDVNQLRNLVAAIIPNESVDVVIFRDGVRSKMTVKVGEQQAVVEETDEVQATVSEDVGLSLRSITPEVAQQMGLKGVDRGVVVAGVAPGSLAARSGIMPGDVLLKAGNKDVTAPADFDAVMTKEALKKGVRLVVRGQDGGKRFVFVRDGN
jgi:serine protease Do